MQVDLSGIAIQQLEEKVLADEQAFSKLESFEGHTFYLTFCVSDLPQYRSSLAKRIDQFKGVLYIFASQLIEAQPFV